MVQVVYYDKGFGSPFKPITVNIGSFPDGTQHITVDRIATEYKRNEGRKIAIVWQYENDSELFTVVSLRQALSGALSLFLPYIPNARMDRAENMDDVFTLKSFCSIINSLHFEKVYVLDAHSNVSLALLDRVVHLWPGTFISRARKIIGNKDILFFYPDAGAMKRYTESIRMPYAYANKIRDQSSGKIKSLEIVNKDMVKGQDILVIDDICSRGGTFLYAAKELKALEANDLYLYISHAENTMFDGEMYNGQWYKKIFTTDSICRPAGADIYNSVVQFPWTDAFNGGTD